MDKRKVKHKNHKSKYSYKQFIIPDKERVEILYEGNTQEVSDYILELAQIKRQALFDNGIKFINIWR